ncbi:MAG: Macrolide export ATP-binding/permease protein MacB [Cyanobacteria bacterium RYN_339]|nr:Macrolide export ATP-binding/permease protein MacB [Cyanobacteria bacterium RYN_339]
MNWYMTIRIALRALLINKMRSFLTILGVIIGVAAVIAMVAIGSGARAQVAAQFSAMGTNMLIIQSGSSQQGGVRGGQGSQPTLTWEDVKAIRTEVSSVAAVAAQLRTNAQVAAQEQNWGTSITGTSPDFFTIRSWNFSQGGPFSQADVDSGAKTCVLGQTVVDNLFGPGTDVVGQTLTIKGIPFQVVGVLESKGQSSNGQDNDDAVYIPETAFQTKIQGGMRQFVSGMVMASATSEDDLPRAERQITELLRDRHHVRSESEDDFSIRNLTEMANAMEAGTQTLSLLLASIAAVSLLVGGIGIMNIMLVSVTERTREIGLRMAIGAKPEQILAQFLVEAVCLSLIGGLVGLGIGVAVATFLAHQFGWPVQVSASVAAIAVIFSALVGVGFGLYPARKASQLNPIDALRFE